MARRGAAAALAAAAGLVLAAVVASSGPGRRPSPRAGADARATARADPAPTSDERASPVAHGAADGGARPPSRAEAAPARAPRYGRDPDPFIRQRHDYPPDTPEKLGPKIGRYLFDLERVKELVRLGDRPDSELARARGEPLSEAERSAARRELQAFFDEVTPIVDQVVAGELSRERALPRIRARRRELDRALGDAVGTEIGAVLPHIRAGR